MELAREVRDAFADLAPEERQRLARLGAVLFMAASLTAVPAGLLLEPPPEAYKHAVSASGFLSGLLLYRLDWTRLPSAALHVFPIGGSMIVVAGVAVFSVVYSFFFVLAAMFVAISARGANVFAAYLAFFVAALALPITYTNADLRGEAVVLLATLPVLLAVALVSRYMFESVKRQKDEYRAFAIQAIALGERIRGATGPAEGDSAADLEVRLRQLSSRSPDPPDGAS